MRLKRAVLDDFRNFEHAIVEPGAEISALVGENGQGKTNALEALYLASALRPLRAVPRRALIRAGASSARIHLSVHHRGTGLTHTIGVRLEGGRRILERDDKAVGSADLVGTFVTVAFTPDDLLLPKAGPDGRRRFLDRAVLNGRPSYLPVALRYAKAMKDRNRLLARGASDAEIEPFDIILARDGARILDARTELVQRIAPRVAERFADIARPAPPLELRYRSTVPDGTAPTETRLLDALGARRERDRQRATTGVGPHVDDLVLHLGDGLARERASQGQHRAIVLALKLVEIQDLGEVIGEAPVLLLDDMSSELDTGRTRQLFDAVRELRGQVILTSTAEPEGLRAAIGSHRAFTSQTVRAGTLSAPVEHGSESP